MKIIHTLLKVNIKPNLSILFLLVAGLSSCGTDDEPAPQEIIKSSEKQITSFVFLLNNNPFQTDVVATIDEENKTIDATVPPDADVSNLLPEIKISKAASINKTTAQNFIEPVLYIVTAEDGSTATYTIKVHFALSQSQVLEAILDANPGNILDWDLQNVTDLGTLTGVITDLEGHIIRLTLGENGLTTVPPEIGLLSNLTYLYIGESALTHLSAEIGQLSNLTELYLHDNLLTTLPPEIGQLSSLVELNLDGNRLISIPNEIAGLSALQTLGLGSNQLTTIPSEIGDLNNLTSLSLGNNQLASVPDEIGLLSNLTFVDLGGNQLSSLPKEIAQLTNLERLQLFSNQLTTIPVEIGQLTNLEFLLLNNNQLTSIPPELGFLTNLESLRMTDNNLNSIPQSVINLILFNNPGMSLTFDTDMLIETSQQDALISIYSANPGNTLGWGVDSFPEVTFNENGDPNVITMNNKNLSRIPVNIGQLTALEALNINNNNLTSLPTSLGNINTLVVIAAGSNQLSTVPSQLGNLANFALLSITNNPITSIPQEVCDQQISNGGILTILTDPNEGCN